METAPYSAGGDLPLGRRRLSFILLLGLSRFKLVQNLLDQFIAVLRHLLADIHHHFVGCATRRSCNSVTLS